jgi:hypothetical protein
MTTASDHSTNAAEAISDRRLRLTAFAATPRAESTLNLLKTALCRVNKDADADDICVALASAWHYVESAAATAIPSSGSPQSDSVEIIADIGGAPLDKLLDCIVDIEVHGIRMELLRREFREHLIDTIGNLSREIAIATAKKTEPDCVIWAGTANPTEWDVDAVAAGLQKALDDQGGAVKFSDLTDCYLTAEGEVAALNDLFCSRPANLRKAATALLQFAVLVEAMKAVGESKSEDTAS